MINCVIELHRHPRLEVSCRYPAYLFCALPEIDFHADDGKVINSWESFSVS